MIDTFINSIDRLMDAIGAIASALLIGLVLIMAGNLLAGYLFNSLSLGLQELSWHIYAAIFLLGIPYALKSGSHVRVDLLFEKFSPKTQATIDFIGTLVFLIPSCLIVIWTGFQFTAAAYQLGLQPDSVGAFFQQLVSTGIGEKSQDPGGLLNRWIIKAVIPLSFVFLLMAALSLALKKWQALRSIKVDPAT